MVLGDSEPITGMGLALPQRGFRVLLQPARQKKASSPAREIPQLRESMEVTPSGRGSPVSLLKRLRVHPSAGHQNKLVEVKAGRVPMRRNRKNSVIVLFCKGKEESRNVRLVPGRKDG